MDLKRILNEYQTGKPIALAVSCGDRELPWRAYYASAMNDPSQPDGDAFGKHLASDNIDYPTINENYISLDPMSIGSEKIPNSGRGAGHIHMDASNTSHWRQLSGFFVKKNIKISQIIFTAGFGDPMLGENILNNLEQNKEMFEIQLGMLAEGGKLISPYFFRLGNLSNESYQGFKSTLYVASLNHRFLLGGQLAFLFRKGGPNPFLKVHSRSNGSLHNLFLDLAKKWSEDKNIEDDLHQLIQEKASESSPFYKKFLYEIGSYYASIFNPEILTNDANTVKHFKENQFEQMKKIIPMYIRYLSGIGLNAKFVTNQKVANELNIPEVIGQNWKKGDYPYGERNHIALVITK